MSLGGVQSCWEKAALRCRQKELSVSDEQTESAKQSQTVVAAARKQREPKSDECKELVRV